MREEGGVGLFRHYSVSCLTSPKDPAPAFHDPTWKWSGGGLKSQQAVGRSEPTGPAVTGQQAGCFLTTSRAALLVALPPSPLLWMLSVEVLPLDLQ